MALIHGISLLLLLPCALSQFIGPQSFSARDIPSDAVSSAVSRAAELADALEEYEANIYQQGFFSRPGTGASFVGAFAKTSLEAKRLSKGAIIAIEATKALARRYRLTKRDIWYEMPNIDVSRTYLSDVCGRRSFRGQCRPSKFRTIDGSCNNLRNPTWGMSKTPFARALPPDYADGVDKPRAARDGTELPNPRIVSTVIHETDSHFASQLSIMLMQWGQFIDHDITLTPMTVGHNMTTLECCPRPSTRDGTFHYLHPACLPIMIPRNDTFYSRYGEKCMSFSRSEATPSEFCKLGVREQMNEITSYLDASMIYGSDKEKYDKLREFRGGRMLSLTHPEGRQYHHLLPKNPDVRDCIPEVHRDIKCFAAGDERVNEHMGLASMHTLWMREHNRLAGKLADINPHWDDDRLYEETRRIIGAMIQHVTYNEFLPVVLGKEYMDRHRMSALEEGYSYDYDPNVNAASNNVFATAAFRFGHTILPKKFPRPGLNFLNPRDDLDLSDIFFRPFALYSNKHPRGVDPLMKGMTEFPPEGYDRFITTEVRDKLFKEAGKPFGFDLPALNIQRGREHGIPGYNYWREYCGLRRARDFFDLQSEMDLRMVDRLSHLYRHVDDIDIFPAMLLERPLPTALVGPTVQCLVGRQFQAYKHGDRYFYDLGDQPHSFTPDQLREIRKMTLAKITCSNTDFMQRLQPRCMFLENNRGNEMRLCNEHPDMDYRVFGERPPFGFGTRPRARPRAAAIRTEVTSVRRAPPRTSPNENPLLSFRGRENSLRGSSVFGAPIRDIFTEVNRNVAADGNNLNFDLNAQAPLFGRP